MLKVKLIKNLRKSILQGHPWVYKDAIENIHGIDQAQICKVVDNKNKVLAWGYFDPYSVIAVRILSLDSKPPNKDFFHEKILGCVSQRLRFFDLQKTNAFRLINGEGDRLPGLVCDIYNRTAILQTDGLGPSQFWDLDFVAQTLLNSGVCRRVYHKPRSKNEASLGHWGDQLQVELEVIKENGLNYFVDILQGQKTGFFLDQRDNRNYLRYWAKDRTVVNMFSYTGGFSVAAGAGEARKVTSVDISPKAISLCDKNWQSNEFSKEQHEGLCVDVFNYVQDVSESFDIVIVDPPSMAHSEKQKAAAIAKYSDLFCQSARLVNSGGDIFLSSCSSHISFSDFYEVAESALSQARRVGQVLRYSGQGVDHPFLHICPEQRYLKFLHLKLN